MSSDFRELRARPREHRRVLGDAVGRSSIRGEADNIQVQRVRREVGESGKAQKLGFQVGPESKLGPV